MLLVHYLRTRLISFKGRCCTMASRSRSRMESSSIDRCVIAFVFVLRLRKRRLSGRFSGVSLFFLWHFSLSLLFFCHHSSLASIGTRIAAQMLPLPLLRHRHRLRLYYRLGSILWPRGRRRRRERGTMLMLFCLSIEQKNYVGQFDPDSIVFTDEKETSSIDLLSVILHSIISLSLSFRSMTDFFIWTEKNGQLDPISIDRRQQHPLSLTQI